MNKSVIDLLVEEAKSYVDIKEIGKLIQSGAKANHLPVQPLYLAMRNLPAEMTSAYLVHLSREQREAMLDIDLWFKDDIDIEKFSFWLKVYSACSDQKIRQEFAKSNQFLLFIKSKVNISTFDEEDPHYPDHDRFFITDDNLLLFEFSEEDEEEIDLVKMIVMEIYFEMGVNNAYSFLFKMVVDSFMTMQEDEYQQKINRQRDYGFVDFMSALKIDNPFTSINVMDNFINKKDLLTPKLSVEATTQSLLVAVATPYQSMSDEINNELLKVSDQSRLDFLKFDFIRLLNSRLELDNSLKSGSVAMSSSASRVKWSFELGFDYLTSKRKIIGEGQRDLSSIFNRYDFIDLYRIGNSLIVLQQKKIRKAQRVNELLGDDNESFMGNYWSSFIEDSFDIPVKLSSRKLGERAKEVVDSMMYDKWKNRSESLISMIPFIAQFGHQFKKMQEDGLLNDSFYLNYQVDQIDFEALIISSFANHCLGNFEKDTNVKKMGLTLKEFKKFVNLILDDKGIISTDDKMNSLILDFLNKFGLNKILGITEYFKIILRRQVEGYDYEYLPDKDYKHVGGAIILSEM